MATSLAFAPPTRQANVSIRRAWLAAARASASRLATFRRCTSTRSTFTCAQDRVLVSGPLNRADYAVQKTGLKLHGARLLHPRAALTQRLYTTLCQCGSHLVQVFGAMVSADLHHLGWNCFMHAVPLSYVLNSHMEFIKFSASTHLSGARRGTTCTEHTLKENPHSRQRCGGARAPCAARRPASARPGAPWPAPTCAAPAPAPASARPHTGVNHRPSAVHSQHRPQRLPV